MAEYQGVCYIINPISPTYFAHLFLTLDTPISTSQLKHHTILEQYFGLPD